MKQIIRIFLVLAVLLVGGGATKAGTTISGLTVKNTLATGANVSAKFYDGGTTAPGSSYSPGAEITSIEAGHYLLLTLNRRALLSDKENLREMLSTLCSVAGEAHVPVIAPLREEARKVVEGCFGRSEATGVTGERPTLPFQILPPQSYLEFGWLTAHAKGIITDSGNVAEEATFNSVPCITLNSYTEHQETVTVGSNVLVGGSAEKLSEALHQLLNGEWKKCALPDRWDGRTAERIAQILLSE